MVCGVTVSPGLKSVTGTCRGVCALKKIICVVTVATGGLVVLKWISVEVMYGKKYMSCGCDCGACVLSVKCVCFVLFVSVVSVKSVVPVNVLRLLDCYACSPVTHDLRIMCLQHV